MTNTLKLNEPPTSGALEAFSDKELASLMKHSVHDLAPFTAVPADQRATNTLAETRRSNLKKTPYGPFR